MSAPQRQSTSTTETTSDFLSSPNPRAEFSSRTEAVECAKSFIGTPYVIGGRVKGGGADCATFLLMYLVECGFANLDDFADVGVYHNDWFLHTSSERYFMRLMRAAPKVLDSICRMNVKAQPGSLALFRVVNSKLFNHGGIITKWPFMLHAHNGGVREINASTHWLTAHRQVAIFDPWSKSEC